MKVVSTIHCSILVVLMTVQVRAQSFPVEIINESPLSDDELFIAVVGEDLSGPPGKYVWVDLLTGEQIPMGLAANTIDGPVYGGDLGPGQNGKYADCFFQLSALPENTFELAPIQGCRIFISKYEQLYLYFFDQQSVYGYSAPNRLNPNDPNQGILYEIIELTYNGYGFFGNTTRVDAYQRPIGMELLGDGGTYQERVGESATHHEIISTWQTTVPNEFQNCLDLSDSTITQPSKIPDFLPGGVYEQYFKSYTDAIWLKYKSVDLKFNAGQKGIWSGRVNEGDSLVLLCIDGPAGFVGRKAIVSRAPDSQEIIEGKGVFNQPHSDPEMDLALQAQLCAAMNRHVIDVGDGDPGLQDWSDPSTYYQVAPANFYAGFWHRSGISIEKLSYGFAYDDVWEQSSSLHTPQPQKLNVIFGNLLSYCTNTLSDYTIKGEGASNKIPPGNYAASATLSVEGTIDSGDCLNLTAGSTITIQNFHVPSGGSFLAQIQECNSSLSSPLSPRLEHAAGNFPTHRESCLKVYPNPASSEVQISMGHCSGKASALLILDLSGRVVNYLETQLDDASMPKTKTYSIKGLNPGLYTVVLVNEQGFLSQKLLKTTAR